MGFALYIYVKPRKNRYPVAGKQDAPFVPPQKQFERPSLHLPLPDSPYEEKSVAEIRINEEEVERGVWTIEI